MSCDVLGEGESWDSWYLSWLGSVINLLSLPQTISLSYGDYEYRHPTDYAEYICFLLALLGVRGVSVLFSTGDFGVGRDCVTIDGFIQFSPQFPATCTCMCPLIRSPQPHAFACPFVTAVGGTTRYLPEFAADFSGGGFSGYFQRPDYQKQATSTFLS
jgi:tripeptidyl-peptidase-1